MSVPDFQSITLPLLKLASDGQEHRIADATQQLAIQFQLTPAERDELLPSGRQSRFANRVGWAKTYLSRACLLEGDRRGVFRITERGRQALAQDPARIDIAFLRQYPELEEFRRATSADKGDAAVELSQDATTPEERIEASYQTVARSLEQELLDQIKARSPAFFENLVVDLLVRMGYGGSLQEAGQRLGRSGDGGVDGIIKEDKLGLDIVYIQAKRWDGTVGRPVVQAFAGSLEGHRARKGVLISTSRFSDDAIQYVGMIEKKIVLIDGEQLVKYMIEHDVGVTEVARYSVKRVALEDLDYYDEGARYVAGAPAEPSSKGG